MVQIRQARPSDTIEMATLLNAIIAKGGTTAMTTPVTAGELLAWMNQLPDRSAWHVALGPDQKVEGFQWIAPHEALPADACDIATFVAIGSTGKGIGSALFRKTLIAARQLGYAWINANIRADNTDGLAYYAGRGFMDYDFIKAKATADGPGMDKQLKRFRL